jgi:hypothetical protein
MRRLHSVYHLNMVRGWVNSTVERIVNSSDAWFKTLEDTLLSMGCDVDGVPRERKLGLMRSAPLRAADLKFERDYWREEAFKNAREADAAERHASTWKRCAGRYRRLALKATESLKTSRG